MNQIVVISGKGGTGKTTIVGALATLVENKVVADCDVDASDLHILLKPQIKERYIFRSGKVAHINKNKCVGCRRCWEVCRFSAIDKNFVVDPALCEGCGFCSLVCFKRAAEMKERVCGEYFISDTQFGPLVHARLYPGRENSGKLITILKQKAKEIAERKNYDWIIVDGSPGIGCPVISSLSEAKCALVITEPTLSGLYDAQRVIKVAQHFGITVKLIINKYDLNMEMTEKIEEYCHNNSIQIIGKLLFDENVVKALTEGKTIVEYSNGEIKEAISKIWDRLQSELK